MRELELHRNARKTKRSRMIFHRWAIGLAIAAAVLVHTLVFLAFLFVLSGRLNASGNGPLAVNFSEEDAVYDELNEEEKHEVQITHQSLPPVQAEALDLHPADLPIPSPINIPPPDLGSKMIAIQDDPLDMGFDVGEEFEEDLFEDGEESEVFSAPIGGNSIVFVFDVSTSMPRQIGTGGVHALKKQLLLRINALAEDKLFNIICFGNKADGLFTKPTPATFEAKQAAAVWMIDYFSGKFTRSRTGQYGRKGIALGVRYVPIEPDDVPYMKGTAGGSRYDLALVAAFQQKASTIFLVTDSNPSMTMRTILGTQKSVAPNDVINIVYRAAGKLYGKQLPLLHCIGVNESGKSYLTQLAMTFRSEYRSIGAGESWTGRGAARPAVRSPR
jgi:hypothetical protein